MEYIRTHPWITFHHRLQGDLPTLWVLLGEAASKIEHLAGSPLMKETASRLHQIYLAKGVLATTAIEGNTLSEEQVLLLLEGKLNLPKSKQYLATEVDNIIRACNQMAVELRAGNIKPLSPSRICAFNEEALRGLELEPEVRPGVFREHSVTVGRYRAAPAKDCPYLMDRLCDWLNGPDFEIPETSPELLMPLATLKAIMAHLYIAWIHPFGDGNGRTARLVELQILLEAGAPTPAAHLLSNFYNQTRAAYYTRLDETSRSFNADHHRQTGTHILGFVQYAVQGLVDGLREQTQFVKKQHLDLTWRNVVFTNLPGTSPANERRRQLIWGLTTAGALVAPAEIPNLNPALAVAYNEKTAKTLSRDLNALVELGLVERVGRGYQAYTQSILAFLPLRKNS